MLKPTYLRIVATTRCNLSCEFCHEEGDHWAGAERELATEDLRRCLDVAAGLGFRKVKFLGGEPFLRRDLPEIVAHARAVLPSADLSIISAGVVPVQRLHDSVAAGLDRGNVSIHGFTPSALSSCIKGANAHAMRQEFLAAALSLGGPLKLNYVYGSMLDRADLGLLLSWAAERGLLVNVLDDLRRELSWVNLAKVVESLRGAPARTSRCADKDSLDTLHWEYADGLRVEFKDQRLGEVAPFKACQTCPKRSRCKEGIVALRLTHKGVLQPCMDRDDLGLPLARLAREEGVQVATKEALAWMEDL
jgi:molybdenum cofactor biosynthesis enzyme MoaA